ncbi:MAG: TIGR03067 domain-containing protein [Planctomycetes bacterium]|nr:TIGR03067 domain-containing protein [Planctomycetota bacterium]
MASWNSLDPDTFESWRFVFTKDKYEFQAGDNSEEGIFKLDSAAKPKKIDLAIKTGNCEGKAQVGIYQFEKDKLKICFARAGDEARPKEFVTQEDPATFVLVLERDKK